MRLTAISRALFACAVFAVVSVFSSLSVKPAFASAGQVGTHVGQGDISSQIKTIEFVKSKSPPANYPITVMVDIGASAADMQRIADALNSGSFAVNIRVLSISMSTTDAQVISFTDQIATTNWTQAKKPIVIFGNELNAFRGNEWGSDNKPATLEAAAAKYNSLLIVLENNLDQKFDLAGVALDPYHADKATAFIDTAKTSFGSPQVNSFATNVYEDVVTSSGLGENLQAGVDLYDHLAAISPKARKVFTEFGYNPFDRDVQKHVDFYKKYETDPLPGDFEYATALIPNLCAPTVTPTNQWYYYVVGKIYDESYQEVNDDCTSKKEAGTFIYPGPVDIFYNTPGDVATKMGKFSEVIANDYLLTCSPQMQFKATLDPGDPTIALPSTSGKRALVNLLDHCGSAVADGGPPDPLCMFNIDNQTVEVRADNAKIPLIRSNGTGRTSSLEGFFSTDLVGMQSLPPGDLVNSFLLTAPSAKLTSRAQICSDNISFLTAISSTCGTIDTPEKQGKISDSQADDQQRFYSKDGVEINACGLDTKVDGFHLREIYDRVSGLTGGDVGSYCQSDLFKNPTGDQETTAGLVMKVQPVTPNAYRIGYLVVYIQSKEEDKLAAQSMISRIVNPMTAGYLRSIFKIIPVLLPANFGIQKSTIVRDNQGNAVDGGSFDGALKRTISPLASKPYMDQVEADAQTNRDNVRGKMAEFNASPEQLQNNGGMVWLPYCNNPLSPESSGLDSEDTALNCAMANYINANLNLGEGNILVHPNQEAPCRFYSDLAGGETANVLNSPVKPEWMSNSLQAYEKADTNPSIKVNGQIYASRADIEKMIEPEDAKMRVFLAVPDAEFGLIKDYEKYLLKTLLTQDLYEKVEAQIAKGEHPETNGFLRMMGVELSAGGGTSKPFFTSSEDKLNPDGTVAPPELKSILANFALQTDANGANPVLWGGWLSKFAYAYTANVTTTTGQKPFSAFDLTNRLLEPYWLSGGQNSAPADEDVVRSCDALRNSTTTTPDIPGVKEMICRAAKKQSTDASTVQQLANFVWGLYKIEGGATRDLAYSGGGSLKCSVNSAGAVTPMGFMVTYCREELGLSPQESFAICPPEARGFDGPGGAESCSADYRLNVCDLDVALTAAAEQGMRFARAVDFQYPAGSPNAGKPNWTWIAGWYAYGNKFLPGAEYRQDTAPYACTPAAPEVSGCGGANYCDCWSGFAENFELDCATVN